jgi:hypothetical protein
MQCGIYLYRILFWISNLLKPFGVRPRPPVHLWTRLTFGRWPVLESQSLWPLGKNLPHPYLRNGTRYERNLSGYPPFFGVQQLNTTTGKSAWYYRRSEIQDGGRSTGSNYNSACRLDGNAISTAIPPFPWFNTSIRPLGSLPDTTGRRKSNMAVAKPEVLITQLVD